jgi:hypothetical protein
MNPPHLVKILVSHKGEPELRRASNDACRSSLEEGLEAFLAVYPRLESRDRQPEQSDFAYRSWRMHRLAPCTLSGLCEPPLEAVS